jgi:OPA family glycerol-3-phosphate transporter-like MFS transporter
MFFIFIFSFYYVLEFFFSKVHELLGITVTQFGIITTGGYITYAVFVVINGYIVDRLGGRSAMLIGLAGTSIMNAGMGFFTLYTPIKGILNVVILTIMFSVSDFFQTFCTTAICKVGVHWYHISERGLFSGIFGIIIAFGFFLAFQVNGAIKSQFHFSSVFFFPAAFLSIFAVLNFIFAKVLLLLHVFILSNFVFSSYLFNIFFPLHI